MNSKQMLLLLPLLLLYSLIAVTGGCGGFHKAGYSPVKSDQSSGKKGKKRPATQRPYVIKGKTYYPVPSANGYRERGLASWYGKMFHGRKTANGETYNMYGTTAAHKTLPMGTMLEVRNLENGRKAVVRINDRGPFVRSRIIDLTYTTAKQLGIVQNGTARVEIIALGEVVKRPTRPTITSDAPSNKIPSKIPSKPIQFVHQDFDKGKFYVQVRAFEHKKEARNLAEQFASKGRDVVIQQYPAAGISLYRVLVYSGTSLKIARQYEVYLNKKGFRDTLVIARDNDGNKTGIH